uniref:LRC5 n=1 Tax=Griffithsia pacifica TaxID=35689 RepID=A0A291FEB5_GRIPA|nr:LRC5 [Griffithsia pacifica]5Y6P_E1 Chain E1, LRC5 [Griffithsia pacifica]5Y6P_F1 Chain F1, LRC5 [Griffithsia pacifica]
MAFVSATPVSQAVRPAPALGAQLAASPLRPEIAHASNSSTPRMGYGAYSYITDKTKGHVNQYYVDKFRIASDWTKGTPKTQADAVLGRTFKGAVLVPTEGIPQEFDPAIAPRDNTVDPDPRIAESEGEVYPWDINYFDPQFLPSAYSDVNDPETVDSSFADFRSSMWESRRESLTAQDFGAVARVQRIKNGLDEKYLMTLDGMLDARYARFQKIAEPAVLSPTGTPMTEIPGTPYLGSVGAMDFIAQEEESVAFWKSGPSTTPVNYKRPSGAQTPNLPYNTAAPVAAINEAQEAQKGQMQLSAGDDE